MPTEPDEVATLATFLRDARKLRQYSIREIARHTDLKPSTIVRIESGASSPRANTLGKLVRALRLSEAELLIFAKLIGKA